MTLKRTYIDLDQSKGVLSIEFIDGITEKVFYKKGAGEDQMMRYCRYSDAKGRGPINHLYLEDRVEKGSKEKPYQYIYMKP